MGAPSINMLLLPIVPREDDQDHCPFSDFDMTVKYNTKENYYVYDGRLDLVTVALRRWRSARVARYIYSDAPPGSGLGTSSIRW